MLRKSTLAGKINGVLGNYDLPTNWPQPVMHSDHLGLTLYEKMKRIIFVFFVILSCNCVFAQKRQLIKYEKHLIAVYDSAVSCYCDMYEKKRFTPTCKMAINAAEILRASGLNKEWYIQTLGIIDNRGDSLLFVQLLNNRCDRPERKLAYEIWNCEEELQVGCGDFFYNNTRLYYIDIKTWKILQRYPDFWIELYPQLDTIRIEETSKQLP